MTMPDGSVLLAFNDDSALRSALTVARSRNGGHSWERLIVLENDSKGSFSYPTLPLLPGKVPPPPPRLLTQISQSRFAFFMMGLPVR